MDKKRRRGIIALLLVLSIGNYLRLEGYALVRPVYFFSILIMGLLGGILISDLAHLYKNRSTDKDKLV